MSQPTQDSPEQREAKADALEQDRIDRADVLARQLNRFRWEVRGYYAIILLFLISEII